MKAFFRSIESFTGRCWEFAPQAFVIATMIWMSYISTQNISLNTVIREHLQRDDIHRPELERLHSKIEREAEKTDRREDRIERRLEQISERLNGIGREESD